MSKEELNCMRECGEKGIFLSNADCEFDLAKEIASTEGKTKKSVFFIGRRIEDLTKELNSD